MDVAQADIAILTNEVRRLGARMGELSARVNVLPTQLDMKVAITDAMASCPLYKRMLERGADEVTGVHDVRAFRDPGYRLAEIEKAAALREAAEAKTRPSIPTALAKLAQRFPTPILYVLFAAGCMAFGAISTWLARAQ